MHVRNHRLHEDDGAAIPFVWSPNQAEGLDVRYLIVHYTASPILQTTLAWFRDPRANASAHVLIGRNGETVQMVSLDRRAWHAGRSTWRGLDNLNAWSIGIELVNAGALERAPSGEWITWRGHAIPEHDVLVAPHKRESRVRGWHRFPDVQIARACEIATALHDRYRFAAVLGHDDVAPDRKIDPGPAFPMEQFVAHVLGASRVKGEGHG